MRSRFFVFALLLAAALLTEAAAGGRARTLKQRTSVLRNADAAAASHHQERSSKWPSFSLSTGEQEQCPCVQRKKVTGIAVFHGLESNPFWREVVLASRQAAKDMDIVLAVRLFDKFSTKDMAIAIQAAALTEPDFMLVSVPDDHVMNALKDVKVPFVVVNAGMNAAEKLGAINYVGLDEFESGKMAANRLTDHFGGKMKQGICVNHQPGNDAVQERCDGLKEKLKEQGIHFKQIDIPDDGRDQKVLKLLKKYLPSAEGPTGIVICGNAVVDPVIEHLEAIGGNTAAITFDTTRDIYSALEHGKLLRAVDQQSYLQGYLPVVLGTQYVTNSIRLSQKVLMTGPKFVSARPEAQISRCIQDGNCPERSKIEIAGVVHGIESDLFWRVVRNGAEQAAKDLGVNLVFALGKGFESGAERMNHEIAEHSQAGRPLFVTIPEDAIVVAVEDAMRRVPVVSINSGGRRAAMLSGMHHVGMDDVHAGHEAAKHLLVASETKCARPMCVVHNTANSGLLDRCAGFKSALQESGQVPALDIVLVPSDSPERMVQTLRPAVQQKDPDCVLLTSMMEVHAMLSSGTNGRVVGTFDPNNETAEAVSNGDLHFVVDQQEYMQGFLPVVLLTIEAQTGQRLVEGITRTGPRLLSSGHEAMSRAACLEKGFPVCDGLAESFEKPKRSAVAPQGGAFFAASLALLTAVLRWML